MRVHDARRVNAKVDRRTGLEALERDECVALLGRAPLGRLVVVLDGQPLAFPVNFTLDGEAIVFRSNEGTKLFAAIGCQVAFECDGTDAVYHTGWSVLATGVCEVVRNGADRARLERLPLQPWCEGPKATWLRIQPRTISGRRIPPHGSSRTEKD